MLEPGDDWVAAVLHAVAAAGPNDGDIVVVASKPISRAQDRFVDLDGVQPSADALDLANRVDKDPALVQLILDESTQVSRASSGVLIVRHRLGHVCANAGIDSSNARPNSTAGRWVILLPSSPSAAAADLRHAIRARLRRDVGVIVSDSLGRPFRLGSVGTAIGTAGVESLRDRRGSTDLHGRTLEHTEVAVADAIAAAADLLAGQADEATPAVLVRGMQAPRRLVAIEATHRAADRDLYA